MSLDRRAMAVNRRHWNEAVPLHVASKDYDVPAFLRGQLTILPLEIEELGPVRGRSLLHLQCHFGMDTLSWARLGARVTGVDFSGPAIAAARHLAAETGLRATFVQANVYHLTRVLRGKFDIVYTAKGVVGWLPDLRRWARVVSRFLKPGGRFYLLEDHPASNIYENESWTRRLVHKVPYFQSGAVRWDSDGTYAAPRAKLVHRVTYEWMHPVSELLGALLGAGLRLQAVREFPFTYWRKFPFMRRGRDGWWHLNGNEGMVPLMWSVRATKPTGGGN